MVDSCGQADAESEAKQATGAETAAEAVAEAKDEATAEAGWWVGAPRFRCGSARTRQVMLTPDY